MPFNVYKSSAGSGKTFTLVKEYIKLSIHKPDHFRHILAITFTNKAANEMKERVIRYLTELSADPPDKKSAAYKFLLPELLKDTSFNEHEISAKARQVIDSILHNYSDFAICTIDSFVHRIIRTFAHDLNIPLNFEVEMDTDKLLSEAIDILLSKAGSDELLTKALVEFTEAKADDEKSWHIENDLQTYAQQLFKEDNLVHLEKLRNLSIKDFLDIRRKLGSAISKFENVIIKTAGEAFGLIRQNEIPTDSFYRGNTGIGKYFENLSNGFIEKINPNIYVTETMEQDKWHAGKATASDKTRIDSIKEQLIEAFLKISGLKEKHHKHYVLMNMVFANIYPLAVLNEIEKIIDEIKKENNILSISEFNRRISEIVISQPVPYIYERTGERYQNYLIDEFQDTSALQWMNLLPLLENSLSYDHFNMIVGDGKQAIYRWRGGDVEQFAILPKVPAQISDQFSIERAEALNRHYNEYSLSSNFRSKAEIIDFNNKFFGFIAESSSEYIKSIYKNCQQVFNAENKGGYIQIDFINSISKNKGIRHCERSEAISQPMGLLRSFLPRNDALGVFRDTSNSNNNEDETYNDCSLNKITEIIRELEGQNFSLRDIAILCRSNNNASAIARHLISLGINVVSDESLLISGSQEVNFLIAIASFISNTNDEIAKYRILHYLTKTKHIKEKELYSISKKLKINKSISTNLFLGYLKENNFSMDITVLSSMPVFDLFEELLSVFGINKITDPYIQFFLDAVFEFSSEKENTIIKFLEWWDEQKDKKSIIVPVGIDAVRIMTIHKSKGLEFPVVIYPYATEKFRNTKDNLWINTEITEVPELKSSLVANSSRMEETEYAGLYNAERDKSMLDLLNVFYVVMTRPSKRLYILSRTPSKDFLKPKSIPDFLASYLQSTGLWDENTQVYSFGEKIPDVKNGQADNNSGISLPCRQAGLHPFSIRHRKQVIHLKTKATDLWDTENPVRNSEWGNLIHYALSNINHAEDVKSAVAQLIQNGMATIEQAEELNKKISAVIADPLINKYFQPGCVIKTEAEILLKDGSTLRPDRVIIEGDKAIVIDYKTGGINDSHEKQISKYAEVLREIGYTETEKFLVYIDLNKVVQV
ncbi:MAG: UvrD-helicase domain-containing protein [Bacteroidales bacterium]